MTSVHPKVESLFTELLFCADEFITVQTAQKMAAELGIKTFDVREIDH